MAPVLVYWKLRGLAQPIRYMLECVGEEYEDKTYDANEGTESNWWKDKSELKIDFPNLPYYVDGDTKMTQSTAILRYIARKHGLVAKTEEDQIRLDVAEGQIGDLKLGYGKLVYNPDFETLKIDYIKEFPGKLKLWSEFLGDGKWILGDQMTYVDFMLYEMLYQHSVLVPGILEDCPNVKAYVERFESMDAIQKYRKSDKFIDRPFNGPSAKFGH